MKDVPAPHQIKAQLDTYVIGQERAKRAVSVAVYNHYKRVILRQQDELRARSCRLQMEMYNRTEEQKMDRWETGMLAKSLAGHDKDKVYVIVGLDEQFTYLADGFPARAYPNFSLLFHRRPQS